jgi:DNA-binding response OmpR family regulator
MTAARPLILLVEDDQDTAMLYLAMLNAEGMEVVHCPDCDQARRWWAHTWRLPDLLIVDMRLPDGNGLDLCSRIPSRPELGNDPPVMVLSAHGDPRLPGRCREAGAQVFLDKLEGLDRLVATARELIRSAVSSPAT